MAKAPTVEITLYAWSLPCLLNDDALAGWPLSPRKNSKKNVKLKPTKRSTAATQVSLRSRSRPKIFGHQ